MMFSRTSLAVTTATLALLNLAVAKDETATTTVDLFQWMESDGQFVGSVLTAAPSATTYHINCIPPETTLRPGQEGEDFGCGTFTIIQGPKTHAMHVTWQPDFTWDLSCEIHGKTSAECSGLKTNFDMFVSETGATVTETEKHTFTGDNLPWAPMRITAGVEKLEGATATGSAEVTETGTGTTSSSTPSETESNAAGMVKLRLATVALVAGVFAAM